MSTFHWFKRCNIKWYNINFYTLIMLRGQKWLLTYLLKWPNNLINGFRPAAAHSPRRLRQLDTPTSILDLVLPTDTRSSCSSTSADPRIKYPSRRSILLTNDKAEPAQPLVRKNCYYIFQHYMHIKFSVIGKLLLKNLQLITDNRT